MPVAYCLQCRQRNVRSPASGRTPHRILHCAGRDAADPKRRTDRRQSLRHRRICLLYGQQKHAENGYPELHVQSEGDTHRRQLHMDVLSLEILAQQPDGQIEFLRLRTIQYGQFQRIRQCTKRTARHRIYPAPVRKRTDRPSCRRPADEPDFRFGQQPGEVSLPPYPDPDCHLRKKRRQHNRKANHGILHPRNENGILTCHIPEDSKDKGFGWSYPAPAETETFIATATRFDIPDNTAAPKELLATFYLLPYGTESVFNLTYTYQAYNSDNTDITQTIVLSNQTLPSTEMWTEGASISYTLGISRKKVTVTAGSLPTWNTGSTETVSETVVIN